MLEPNGKTLTILDEGDEAARPALAFTHPDDVLQSTSMSVAAKRALLAAWASDTHAVPDRPAMRQLDSGAIVTIDAVLAALRALDAAPERPAPRGVRQDGPMVSRSLASRWRRPLLRHDRDDDDDDPPPCPAAALPPGLELELRRRRDTAWALAAA